MGAEHQNRLMLPRWTSQAPTYGQNPRNLRLLGCHVALNIKVFPLKGLVLKLVTSWQNYRGEWTTAGVPTSSVSYSMGKFIANRLLGGGPG